MARGAGGSGHPEPDGLIVGGGKLVLVKLEWVPAHPENVTHAVGGQQVMSHTPVDVGLGKESNCSGKLARTVVANLSPGPDRQ